MFRRFQIYRERICVVLAVVILAASGGVSFGQAVKDTFDKANSEYAAGNFEEARKGYEELLKSETGDAAIYLNLGNVEYRLGNYAKAALNYRRALALEPGNAGARESLDRVLEKLGVVAPGLNAPEIVGHYLDFDIITMIGSVLFWCGTLLVVFGIFASKRRKGVVVLGVILTFLGATAGVISSMGDSRITLASTALVVGKDADVLKVPANNAEKLATLPPGSPVLIQATRDDWTFVTLPTGIEGWMKKDAIERVLPKGD